MKNIFCAKCQQIAPHQGSVDGNGEFLFHCQNVITDEKGNEIPCNRFVKFHKNVTKDEFKNLLSLHEEHNKGQVSLEGQEERLLELMDTEDSEQKKKKKS